MTNYQCTHNMNLHSCAGNCGLHGWSRRRPSRANCTTGNVLIFSQTYQQWLCEKCLIKVEAVAKRVAGKRSVVLADEIATINYDLVKSIAGGRDDITRQDVGVGLIWREAHVTCDNCGRPEGIWYLKEVDATLCAGCFKKADAFRRRLLPKLLREPARVVITPNTETFWRNRGQRNAD